MAAKPNTAAAGKKWFQGLGHSPLPNNPPFASPELLKEARLTLPCGEHTPGHWDLPPNCDDQESHYTSFLQLGLPAGIIAEPRQAKGFECSSHEQPGTWGPSFLQALLPPPNAQAVSCDLLWPIWHLEGIHKKHRLLKGAARLEYLPFGTCPTPFCPCPTPFGTCPTSFRTCPTPCTSRCLANLLLFPS